MLENTFTTWAWIEVAQWQQQLFVQILPKIIVSNTILPNR